MRHSKVVARFDPGREQILVGDKVAQTVLSVAHRLLVLFHQLLHIGSRHALAQEELLLFFGEILVKNEAENKVLVLARIHFATHAIRGFPNLRGELLLVHAVPFRISAQIDLL